MFGDGDLTLSTLKLWSTLEFSRVFSVFADVEGTAAQLKRGVTPLQLFLSINKDLAYSAG